MVVTVGAVILAAATHFDPKLAFAFSPGAFALGGRSSPAWARR